MFFAVLWNTTWKELLKTLWVEVGTHYCKRWTIVWSAFRRRPRTAKRIGVKRTRTILQKEFSPTTSVSQFTCRSMPLSRCGFILSQPKGRNKRLWYMAFLCWEWTHQFSVQRSEKNQEWLQRKTSGFPEKGDSKRPIWDLSKQPKASNFRVHAHKKYPYEKAVIEKGCYRSIPSGDLW